MTHPQEESGVTQPKEKPSRTMRKIALIGAVVLFLGPPLAFLAWVADGERFINSDDIARMDEGSPTRPKQVMFVKLKLADGSNGIDVRYTHMVKYNLNNSSIESFLEQVLNGQAIKWKELKTVKPGGDGVSRLSIENKERMYVAFDLDCTNCRFAEGAIPFRVEGGKKEYLRLARLAWLEGQSEGSTKVKHGSILPSNAGRAIGYFIAKGDREHQNGKFRSHFNIYLDLTYNNEPAVPISIDPDVGYPGGHPPEPACTGEDCGLVSPPIAPASAGSS